MMNQTLLSLLVVVAAVTLACADSVRHSVWEDATEASVDSARDCLPPALQALYTKLPDVDYVGLPQNNRTALVHCESLLLGYTYQRLSTAWSICDALASGLVLYENCARRLPAVLLPVMPSPRFTVCRAACLDALDAQGRTADLFRHRYSAGTQCLRLKTVHALLLTFL